MYMDRIHGNKDQNGVYLLDKSDKINLSDCNMEYQDDKQLYSYFSCMNTFTV